MSALVMSDVCFAYDDGGVASRKTRGRNAAVLAPERLALKHVNLTVDDGEFLCLVGHSGCGKTTLLRTLAGLQKPDSGTISIKGKPLDGPGLDRSVVFQNYSLFPWMTALENVEFGVSQASIELGRRLSASQIKETSLFYLEKVDMSDARDAHPYQLSGGMQQRVAIARALAMNAEILLFDEPFGALDVKTRRELQALMESLWCHDAVRKTAVFVTHDIEEALLLADRVVFMSAGMLRDEFRVEGERPRDPETFVSSNACKALRADLVDLFYHAAETADGRGESTFVCEAGGAL